LAQKQTDSTSWPLTPVYTRAKLGYNWAGRCANR